MDFSNILNFISESLTADIAGINTLYIVALGLVLVLAVWAVIKKRKNVQPREHTELHDTASNVFEELQQEREEDGFMPSVVSAVQEEPYFEMEKSQAAYNEPIVLASASAAAVQPIKRKKRESMRNGKKISKTDFSDFSGQRLLIAEDNLINQKVLNGVLNESGIDVVMADDGQIVLDILEQDRNFDIILMDAHMPRLDGFEATRKIRENPAYDHIAVIALSGDTASDDIRHMREAGMEDNLEKPLKMDMLYDVMSMYYTMDEPRTEDDDTADVEELEITVNIDDMPSLDYAQGMQICGGDEKMYKQLLREFFVAYKDSPKKLREALMQEDYKEVQSILIDLKGTASNLGAIQFIHVLERFLSELLKRNTAAYSGLFKEYQKNLLLLLKSIQKAFSA